jgi:phosphoribosylaminoimidazolecarboxamide formyltransferase/IMP cyclohydrolase
MRRSLLPVRRALVSVSDKSGLVPFCRGLADLGVALVSSGGTAKALEAAGIPVIRVSQVTGFPEILDGRVKTLNPRIHGGLLARKDLPAHLAQLAEHGIEPFDLVVVNLYPFARAVAREGVALEEALENIDIGGPAMVRASAKNFPSVAVVVDPARYDGVLAELRERGGVACETRFALAKEAFAHTALYDGAVSAYLAGIDGGGAPLPGPAFPEALVVGGRKLLTLRYGENPHQQAAWYSWGTSPEPTLDRAEQLGGKEMSYNNILDADSALGLVREFDLPACAIIKHNNPCGCATAEGPAEAHAKALATDPVSAFGGVVAFNREVDEAAARAVAGVFTEVVVAPGYSGPALAVLAEKKNLRLLRLPGMEGAVFDPRLLSLRSAGAGLLAQTRDLRAPAEEVPRVVTRRAPAPEESRALAFAWRVAKHTKSNAVVYAREGQLVGIGAGQMSRVDSVRIGAQRAVLPVKGSVAASDAFFPFRDGLDVIAKAGAKAVIQPGGSMRDEEVFAAADEHGMAMVVTGMRHFRH